jgi:hypothetical protein
MLGIEDESKLLEFHQTLGQAGIDAFLFYEPDFEKPGHTALATRIITEAKDRKMFQNFKLWSI